MTFVKYMHVERLASDNPEIDGLLDGRLYIFPKLDGSNHCVWFDEDEDKVCCASRNLKLTDESDATGFYHDYYLPHRAKLDFIATKYKNLVFYGEYMKPHIIRDYDDTIWDEWMVFDVFDKSTKKWMHYDDYRPILEEANLLSIPYMVAVNAVDADFDRYVKNNHMFLPDDVLGEGIVIKNYSFVNKYGRTTWAKIVADEYKQKKYNPEENKDKAEDNFINLNLDYSFIEKEYYKFCEFYGEWNDIMIPDFIKHVWQEWWKDYSFDLIGMGKGVIDLGKLRGKASRKIVSAVLKISRERKIE